MRGDLRRPGGVDSVHETFAAAGPFGGGAHFAHEPSGPAISLPFDSFAIQPLYVDRGFNFLFFEGLKYKTAATYHAPVPDRSQFNSID